MTLKVISSLSSTLQMPVTTMSSRDHPFNRSTRPLLAERKPQMLLKKKTENNKVHGFNDFDIMSQQFRNLNTHIGYPYGSPPSPSINSDDFIFSDNEDNIYNTSTPKIYKTVVGVVNNNINKDLNTTTSRLNHDQNWLDRQHTNGRKVFLDHDNTNGPFIFGVHTTKGNYGKVTTVINGTKAYATELRYPLNQSNSDSSSSSRGTDKDSRQLVKTRLKNTKRSYKDKKLNKANKPNIKCVLVGDGAVGKTSLIVSYLENRFLKEHIPTASDIYNAEVTVNDSPVDVTICDTAGQDTLDPLRELCYPDSNVFLLCFSVIKPETFRSIKAKWAPKFSKTKAALILVGTQSDLRTNNSILSKLQIKGEMAISFADAWDFATSIGAKYIETSSLTQEKIKDVFDAAIWDALVPTHYPPTPPLWKKLLCLV